MKYIRKTNLFNIQEGNLPPQFITLSNYGEMMTGNHLSVNTKLFPSSFICMYVPGLDSNERITSFIKRVSAHYENKLAFLRDVQTAGELKTSKIEPLKYLLNAINGWTHDLGINQPPEITHMGDLVEQNYNGVWSDMLCTISAGINPYKYTVYATSDKQVEFDYGKDYTNISYLYGWSISTPYKVTMTLPPGIKAYRHMPDYTVSNYLSLKNAKPEPTSAYMEFKFCGIKPDEHVHLSYCITTHLDSNIRKQSFLTSDTNQELVPSHNIGYISGEVDLVQPAVTPSPETTTPYPTTPVTGTTFVPYSIYASVTPTYSTTPMPITLQCGCYDDNTLFIDKLLYNKKQNDLLHAKELRSIIVNNTYFNLPGEFVLNENAKNGITFSFDKSDAMTSYIPENMKFKSEWIGPKMYKDVNPVFDKDGYKYTVSKVSDPDDFFITKSIDMTKSSIKFNIIIPLFDTFIDEPLSVHTGSRNKHIFNELNNPEEDKPVIVLDGNVADLSTCFIPYGIWFSGHKPVELNRNTDETSSLFIQPSWTLTLSSQFKPFPYSEQYIGSDKSVIMSGINEHETFAQILSRQNAIMDRMSHYDTLITDLRTEINELKSKIQNS